MSISTVISGINTIEKLVPVIESIGHEIGPIIEKEVADGKEVWSDLIVAFEDLKAAVVAVKASTATIGK